MISAHLSGNLPFPVSGASPTWDIDVSLELMIAPHDGGFIFDGDLYGDGFPNAEVFIEDVAGNRVMLGHFQTAHGPSYGPMVQIAGTGTAPMLALTGYVGLRDGRFNHCGF